MSHLNRPLWGLALAGAALAAGAQTPTTDHSQHHPATPPTAPSTPATPAAPLSPPAAAPSAAALDSQMKAMRDMHDKMAAARTPEERQALMAEHMKTMREGMGMMSRMRSPGMAGMQHGGSPMGEAMMERHRMMEQRMDMMQSMLQMMMDRLDAGPAPAPAK